MKRVYVYECSNNSIIDKTGKLLLVSDDTKLFQDELCSRFSNLMPLIRIFSLNGCEIHDVRVIRDEETIYITSFCEVYFPKSHTVFSKRPIDEALADMSIKEQKIDLNCKTKLNTQDWITLNVGGKHFKTSRATVMTKEPQSMLARMFAHNGEDYLMKPSETDATGAYLIDRSPEYFEAILNYLRHGEIILDKQINPKGVLEEAKFYGLDSMIPQLTWLIENAESTVSDNTPLTRKDVIRSLILTPTSSELRFQGVNLAGADLNRLDLRNINFKYACLSKCNLSGANLSQCCLERADLSYANLEGAQLTNVKALCAHMEGANLKGCNMEDPAGCRAVMEGVNLKGANLEGSNMAGVNLRVATLKNANLQNCDLRAAVLAGADLESCDLSGSDLHEANLRGANLKDAAFELMLTPLHMSQTIR